MPDRLAAGCLALALCIAGPALAEPIVDYENLPVKTQTGASATPEEVRAAIVSAGSTIKWEGRRPKRGDLKWNFTDIGPGQLVGTLIVHGGRHMMEVNIPYAADRYSVLYRTSRDMDYKDSEGVRDIHPNYNVWISQFVRAVNLEFARFAPRAGGGGDAAVEVSFWESVRNSNNPAEVQAYLDQFPNGRFAILARNRLASLGVAPKAAPSPSAAPAPAAPAAVSKAAAPAGANEAIPRVGDTWTYRYVPQRGRVGNYKVVVTAASTLGVRDRSGLDSIELERQHSAGRYLASMGPIWLFSPYLLVFDATPPQVWELERLEPQMCPGGFTCSVKGRARSTETITILAGTFVTTKVEIDLKVVGPRTPWDQEVSNWVLTAWYAPEVKRVVKYHSRGSASSLTETRFELELVSYKLNGP